MSLKYDCARSWKPGILMDNMSVCLCCASPDAKLHSWQLSQQLVCHAAASTFGAALRWWLPGLQPQPQALQPD